MADAGKKISFGFSKFTKKQNLGAAPCSRKQKIELIDCLESHTIKIKGVLEEIYTPLVIPMTISNSTLLQRKKNTTKSQEVDDRPDSELTPDELAARELIRETQNSISNAESKILTLPAIIDEADTITDKEEPTLEDYDNVPISDYGLAMLRGMGWKDGMGIGKSNGIAKVKEPNLRPKGMGLGANIAAVKKVSEANGEELVLKKGGYAKITDGKQKGQYCEVQGFDDEACRIIVKTSLKGLILTLNEFLVIPVTSEEYTKSSKVINNAKYEEYKNKEEQSSSSMQDQKNLDERIEISKISKSEYKNKPDRQDTHKYKSSHSRKDHRHRGAEIDRRRRNTDNSSDSEQEYRRKKDKERSKHRH